MPGWKKGSKLAFAAVSLIAASASVAFALAAGASNGQQLYRSTEFVVSAGLGLQNQPSISGDWVVWRTIPAPSTSSFAEIRARQLPNGPELVLGQQGVFDPWPDVWGNTVVWMDYDSIATRVTGSIVTYDLATQQKNVLFSLSGVLMDAKVSEKAVVWRGAPYDNYVMKLYIYDRDSKREMIVPAVAPSGPDVWGKTMVWVEGNGPLRDIYAYSLDTEARTTVSSAREEVTPPAISGTRVVWGVHRINEWRLMVRDLNLAGVSDVTSLGSEYPMGLDIDRDIVVWSATGATDIDVFGYDLAKGQKFIIDRSVGRQVLPRISGRRIVWVDTRNGGAGKYEGDYSVYGAQLDNGPASPPPAIGVPDAVDSRIEIVWPHRGGPVNQAALANIEAVLFQPDTLDLPACQWSPRVQLWAALNNDPVRLLAYGLKYLGGVATPAWSFNNVDVSAAMDPTNKIYFFARTDGTPSRSNVWSHGVDARTYYPRQDAPAGIGNASGEVEAKIEIVWPHNDAPVSQANLVNIKAMIFQPGTLMSVPPNWDPTVRLLQGLNNDVLRPVAMGSKRLVQGLGFTYPVWDFNNIDVSQVPQGESNKYFFSLDIDGGSVRPNVWVHGSSGLTYFPQKDTPTKTCDRLIPQ